MQAVYTLVEKVSDSRVNVLVTGESGTGKELVARAIHYQGSAREAVYPDQLWCDPGKPA